VSTSTDPKNCGTCGTACAAGEVCDGGKCGLSCSTPLTKCGTGATAACTSTANDAKNCGACGTACAGAHVTTDACIAGKCNYDSCAAGFADCDAKRDNGCEVDATADALNCGRCGNACGGVNVDAVKCTMGACDYGTCSAGFADCDMKRDNGCEINTKTDAKNCGMCGNSCSAGQVCNMGSCEAACSTPLTKCSVTGTAGYCSDLTNDPVNCGVCGTKCAPANAVAATCSASKCGYSACKAGFGDCNANLADGCETATTADVKNCGACGVTCTAANVGKATCAAGACGFDACKTGYTDCDKVAANGCEINTNSDAANCGACGKVCAYGEVCATGACVDPTGVSVIEPGNTTAATRPRDTSYSIGTAGSSTIYYTTDGSTPTVGAATTKSGASPIVLGPLATGTVVKWFAKTPLATEAVRTFTATTDATAPANNFGAIVEKVRFDASGGPAVRVAPGATVTGKLNTQWWRSNGSGYCPGCVDQFYVSVDGVGPLSCDNSGAGTYPGKTTTDGTFSFKAPAVAGRYVMHQGIDLNFTCSAIYVGGEEVAVIYVQ
jgi:hypothetical protein